MTQEPVTIGPLSHIVVLNENGGFGNPPGGTPGVGQDEAEGFIGFIKVIPGNGDGDGLDRFPRGEADIERTGGGVIGAGRGGAGEAVDAEGTDGKGTGEAEYSPLR